MAYGSRRPSRRMSRTKRWGSTVQSNGRQRTVGFYGRYRSTGAKRTGSSKTELKFLDKNTPDADVLTTGGVVASLINMAQGTSENERIGRQVLGVNWMISGKAIMNADSATFDAQSSTNRVRVIVFLDRQSNGAAATTTDILVTADIDSFYSMVNKDRFYVLKDKKIFLNANFLISATITGAVMKTFFLKGSLKKLPFLYSGTAGNMSNVRSNNIGVLLIAEFAETGANGVKVGFRTRFQYVDP